MTMHKIDTKSLAMNPFSKIENQWALVGAGTIDKFNMMTVSWAGFGVVLFHDVCTVYVRESRYTKQFMDENERFTLTFVKEGHEDALKLCGAKSGREMDKMKDSGLTPIPLEGTVGFEEAELTFVCRKLYCADMPKENFMSDETLERAYPNGDYHTMYIGQIIAVYASESAMESPADEI